MTKAVPLTSGLGELMGAGTLVTVLVLSPDGRVKVDPGVLHGRSEVESSVRLVQGRDQLSNAQVYWFVWIAIELDGSNAPVRYKGLAVSELWIDPIHHLGYKVVAEAVNRMSDAIAGRINVKTLGPHERGLIAHQLRMLSPEVWERSSDTLKGTFG